jgi:hypothetical protein
VGSALLPDDPTAATVAALFGSGAVTVVEGMRAAEAVARLAARRGGVR